MGEFNKKKRYKKYIYSPLTFILMLVILAVLVKALWGVYNKEKLSAIYLEREQAELNKMMERKNELSESVEYLKTERGVEAEIRSKFRVVKEGEQVAVIVGEENAAAAAVSAPAGTSTELSFWGKMLKFFGF